MFRSNPRYVLFIHLVVNDMVQVSVSSLLHVVSYVFLTVSVPFCSLALLAAVLTTHNTPLNLAGMAAERYVAVCLPLRYGRVCTPARTYGLIGLMWAASLLAVLPDHVLVLSSRPPAFFRSRVICSGDAFKDGGRKEVSHAVFLVLVWLTLLYTYVGITCAARRASVRTRRARNTVLLHAAQLLLSMLSYVRAPLEQGLLRLLPASYLSVLFASFVFIQMLPRFASSLVYGLRDRSFRQYVRRYLVCALSAPGQ